jgi:lysozyme
MKEALELIKKHEGCHKRQKDGTLVAYLCPAGVWTIGWGSTGPLIVEGTIWTQEEADAALTKEVKRIIKRVVKLSPSITGSDTKIAAITSFVYNLGEGAYKSSTLKKRIDAKDWISAVAEIKRWDKAKGKVLPGLVTRRKDEADLLLK